MDRRTTIKWVLAASASLPFAKAFALAGESLAKRTTAHVKTANGYGTDPQLIDAYKPGELWPLTFTPEQRRTASALCDLIIPADDKSPSATAVGVVDFLDEWISAPYKEQRQDRKLVLDGLRWLDRESARRFEKHFAALDTQQQRSICDDICHAAQARREFAEAAIFFARYRDLTAGGFYTTPQGRNDLQYVGNVPLQHFDGPPLEVLKKVGLA